MVYFSDELLGTNQSMQFGKEKGDGHFFANVSISKLLSLSVQTCQLPIFNTSKHMQLHEHTREINWLVWGYMHLQIFTE